MMKFDKNAAIILSACLLVLVAVIGTVLLNYLSDRSANEMITSGAQPSLMQIYSTEPPSATPMQSIFIQIKGEVRNPGVYELPVDSRITDAVEAAGGFSINAAPDAINLAKRLHDEDEIIIPSQTEAAAMTPPPSTGNQEAPPSAALKDNPVNINTADLQELCTLPGIGNVSAQNIIDYRTANGSFERTEDIMNVPGIGEARFITIRDMITTK